MLLTAANTLSQSLGLKPYGALLSLAVFLYTCACFSLRPWVPRSLQVAPPSLLRYTRFLVLSMPGVFSFKDGQIFSPHLARALSQTVTLTITAIPPVLQPCVALYQVCEVLYTPPLATFFFFLLFCFLFRLLFCFLLFRPRLKELVR